MTGKINVAMVILEYHPIIGGAQRQLALLAPHLQSLNIEFSVITRRYPGLADFETVDGVPVYRLPAQGPKAVASLNYSVASLRRLAQLKPDLIHAYNLFSPLTTAITYKLVSGTPVVVKILRGGQLGDVIRLKNKLFGKQRIDIFRKTVDTFITISQEIDGELADLRIDDRKRTYIPNGVDTDDFRPLPAQARDAARAALNLPDGPLVVYTGRLVPEKKVDLLLKVWPNIRSKHPTATLVIVGEGEQAASLRNQAVEGVIFTGGVADVRPYLQTADLFVLPSSTEGLSNSLLEAMATGLAVLATTVGGAPDVIEGQVNGWLIPPNNSQAIQNSVSTLLADEECRRRLGAAARRTIEERYALPVVAGQLRSLYETVLER